MAKSTDDKKILSYIDVVLRQSDLTILSKQCFLNDRIIEFYFSYLSTCYPSLDILLVPPAISFLIANCPDTESLKIILEPLNFTDRKIVIFTVNNNNDVNEAEGGTHWSLLVFVRNGEFFVHHDSCGGINRSSARQLYKSVTGLLGYSSFDESGGYVEHKESPQQNNGYDCGLYVTAIARIICSWFENDSNESKKDESHLWYSELETVTPRAVSEMRNEILELIKDLIAKQ